MELTIFKLCYMGVSTDGGTPKWMVYNYWEIPKNDEFWGTLIL